MANIQLPKHPFGKIALSCSGGGYRAASFHLGTMSYLNHVKLGGNPLLEQVKLISTVSGGSITGVVYALMKQDGKSFDEIYHFLLERLINIDLLHQGFEMLNPTATWPYVYKRKNLINVFAEQYDQAFTNGASMGVFDKMNSHLEAVVFNSTEFENAVNFRFRNGGWSYSGNFYNRIPANQLREVKLSDVMATSSCFPGGFEPMCWPDDFVHTQSPNLEALAAKNAAADVSPLGIMDGGIYDNQGIDSILRYKENSEQPYFDLIILSDVASPDMKPYVPFKEKPKTGFRALTLRKLNNGVKSFDRIGSMILWAVVCLGVFSPFFFGMGTNWLAGVCWTVAGFALLFLLARQLVKKKLKSLLFQLLFKIRDHIPAFYLKRLANFDITGLSVHRAEPLIMDRVNSLVTLLSSVFLKVVRRLNYNRLYEEETYKYRRLSTLIKCLTRDNLAGTNSGTKERKGFFSGDYDADIGPAIQAVVEEAAAFGTTLWFTEQEKLNNVLKKLVATGQITLCYNLILYLEQLKSVQDQQQDADLDPLVAENIDGLYAQCIADWAMFRKDPMFLVKIKEASA
jgi:predicted acylesterase/phospholipase RssA